MLRSKFRGFVALVCAAPGLALAAPGDLYVGVRGGITQSGIDSGEVTAGLRSRGHNVTATVDDSDVAGHFYVGRRISDGMALEIGLMNLGEYDVRVSGTTTLTAQQLARDVVDVQPKTGNAVSLLGRFEVPMIPNRLFFTPRVGGFYWSSDTEVATSSGVQTISDDGVGVTVALGLDAAIVGGLHLGVGWELMRPDQEGATRLWYAQAEYHFGR